MNLEKISGIVSVALEDHLQSRILLWLGVSSFVTFVAAAIVMILSLIWGGFWAWSVSISVTLSMVVGLVRRKYLQEIRSPND